MVYTIDCQKCEATRTYGQTKRQLKIRINERIKYKYK